ncbi:MAG: archaeal proteasome endopeptidase complex subunit beta [Candidatus ainarchaeum sp.]|nr:archaeal proteasome endopeptidase complex subunit beta [Candidatus ainarchaeum sp.]
MDSKEQMIKKTGTTTVGLVCKDGVVLASDKRATMGYYIANKKTPKIHLISDYIGMTIAGGVGDAQSLVRWMRAEIRMYELKHGRRMTVEGAATLLANILSGNKYYPFFVQLLVGGMDEKAHVFSVDMLGGVTEEDITATGSGSPIAMGVLEEMYIKDGSVKDNAPIAYRAVGAAMKRDAGSGEGVDVLIITPHGTEMLGDKDFKRHPAQQAKEKEAKE